MTKDEIKALISAKVAGQGNQVDAGGALPDLLNGILDLIPEVAEPLIITGIWNDGFLPNAGQPSWNDAYNAFIAGRVVILKYSQSGFTEYSSVAYYSDDSGSLVGFGALHETISWFSE